MSLGDRLRGWLGQVERQERCRHGEHDVKSTIEPQRGGWQVVSRCSRCPWTDSQPISRSAVRRERRAAKSPAMRQAQRNHRRAFRGIVSFPTKITLARQTERQGRRIEEQHADLLARRRARTELARAQATADQLQEAA